MALTNKLTAIADAIREKTGGTDLLTLDGMVEAVNGLSTGGGDIDAIIDRSVIEVTSGVEKVGGYAFYNARNLKTGNFPAATDIGGDSFYGCSSLESINAPYVTDIGSGAFSSCAKLLRCEMPLAGAASNAFDGCSILEFIDVKGSRYNNLATYTFNNCYCLKTLIIRLDTSIWRLQNTNAFSNCYHLHGTTNATYNPEGLKDGYIYVPRALIEDYKVATNWTIFASQFRAIEDYPEICGGDS